VAVRNDAPMSDRIARADRGEAAREVVNALDQPGEGPPRAVPAVAWATVG
jgi:hypothetical protein